MHRNPVNPFSLVSSAEKREYSSQPLGACPGQKEFQVGSAFLMNRAYENRKFQLILRQKWLADYAEALDAIARLCTSDSELDLLFHLMDRFTFFEGKDTSRSVGELIGHMKDHWRLTSSATQIVAVSQDDSPDSSQALVQKLKPRLVEFEIGDTHVSNSVNKVARNASGRPTIVLCDEFVGTGTTMANKVNFVQNSVQSHSVSTSKEINVQIYVAVLAAMEPARQMIVDALTANGHAADNYFATVELPRGISDCFEAAEVGVRTSEMIRLESCLDQKQLPSGMTEFPTMGYGRAEALYAAEDENIPNSVFPLFWWRHLADGNSRKPMFNRYQ